MHMSSTQIADDLAERIRAGQYPPGTQLVAAELAASYDCPVTRIRRAMVRLSTLGLVEYRPGLGTYVTGPDDPSRPHRLRPRPGDPPPRRT